MIDFTDRQLLIAMIILDLVILIPAAFCYYRVLVRQNGRILETIKMKDEEIAKQLAEIIKMKNKIITNQFYKLEIAKSFLQESHTRDSKGRMTKKGVVYQKYSEDAELVNIKNMSDGELIARCKSENFKI